LSLAREKQAVILATLKLEVDLLFAGSKGAGSTFQTEDVVEACPPLFSLGQMQAAD